MPINDVQLTEDRWLDFFEHYKGLPGQRRGLLMLRKHIIEADPGLLTEGAQWIEETRQNAQPDVPNTWEGIEMAARVAGAKFPALVAAQWALESDWGKKPAGVNNFWGLKGLSGTVKATLEEVNGVMRPETATFKDFPTIRAGVEYLVTRWYADFQQHKGVNRANTIAEAARLLQSHGYATDSKYPEKLLGILSRRTPTLATPARQPATTRHFLRLTRASRVNSRGLVELALERVEFGGGLAGRLIVVSGAPGRQSFRTAAASVPGSLEPLPEGLWRMEEPVWAGPVGDWGKSWGPGLGPVSIPMAYVRPGATRRSAI